MGWSDMEILCKRHPDHRQQPGVCSCCLVEKLNNLSQSPDPSRMIRTLVAIPSASLSATGSSTSLSPVHHHHHHHHHRRHASTGGSSLGLFLSSTGGGLKKSRSIAFVTTNHGGGVAEHDGKQKKGIGFWKKLIRSTGKGSKKAVMHSTTVKPTSDHQF